VPGDAHDAGEVVKRSHAALAGLLLAAGCGTTQPQGPAAANLDVPAWAGDAIWYQIFVERFRNGDPSNDPTAHDIHGVTDELAPEGWRPTPWTWDWYRQEPWAGIRQHAERGELVIRPGPPQVEPETQAVVRQALVVVRPSEIRRVSLCRMMPFWSRKFSEIR
jgi:hypothetical protein